MCPLKQNNTCLHLHSCCTNKHISNLHTSQNNKDAHAKANTLLAHPTTRYFTLINAGKLNKQTPDNTIPSCLLPCSCYLPRCKCPTQLHPDILCTLGATPMAKPSFSPNPNLQFQLFEFTYYNNRFPLETTTRNTPYSYYSPNKDGKSSHHDHNKPNSWHHSHPNHQKSRSPRIPTLKNSQTHDSLSQISIRYLTHIWVIRKAPWISRINKE